MKLLVIVLCSLGIAFGASADSGPRNPHPIVKDRQADSIDESFECTLCKALITLLDDFLEENGTEENAEKFLEGVCSKFPDTTRDECKGFVKAYYPTIIQLLVARLQPDDICQKLKICTNTKVDSKEVALGSIECNLCDAVITEVDKLLLENRTMEEIGKVLGDACSVLPGEIGATCKTLIDQYLPDIIDILANNILQPDAVCKAFGLCTETKLESKRVSLGSIECDMCKAAMAELDKLLKENSTEAEIQKALEDVCSLFPGEIGVTCKTLVDEYLPEIIDLIINKGLKPDAVCKAIDLCPEAKSRRGYNQCKNATDCSQQFSCPYGAECIHQAGKVFGDCACLLPAGRRDVGSHTPNACSNHPCQHGVCSLSRTGYQCMCYPGYVGTNCDAAFLDLHAASIALARPARTQCMWDYNCRGVYCPTGSYPHCPKDHGLAASTCVCKHNH